MLKPCALADAHDGILSAVEEDGTYREVAASIGLERDPRSPMAGARLEEAAGGRWQSGRALATSVLIVVKMQPFWEDRRLVDHVLLPTLEPRHIASTG